MIHRIFKTFNFQDFFIICFDLALQNRFKKQLDPTKLVFLYVLSINLTFKISSFFFLNTKMKYLYLSKWSRSFFWEKLCFYWQGWPKKSCYVLEKNVPEWRHILNLIFITRNLGNLEVEKLEESSRKDEQIKRLQQME